MMRPTTRTPVGTRLDLDAAYRCHAEPLRRYVFDRVLDEEVAVEIVAEAFAQACASRGHGDARRGDIVGWLFSTARRLTADHLRRVRAAEHAFALIEHLARSPEEPLEVSVTEDTTSPAFSRLARLPESQRDATYRRVLLEEPYAAIAADLGCDESTVRQRVHRGLSALRRHLGPTYAS